MRNANAIAELLCAALSSAPEVVRPRRDFSADEEIEMAFGDPAPALGAGEAFRPPAPPADDRGTHLSEPMDQPELADPTNPDAILAYLDELHTRCAPHEAAAIRDQIFVLRYLDIGLGDPGENR